MLGTAHARPIVRRPEEARGVLYFVYKIMRFKGAICVGRCVVLVLGVPFAWLDAVGFFVCAPGRISIICDD